MPHARECTKGWQYAGYRMTVFSDTVGLAVVPPASSPRHYGEKIRSVSEEMRGYRRRKPMDRPLIRLPAPSPRKDGEKDGRGAVAILDELYIDEAAVEAHQETPHFKNCASKISSLAERTAYVVTPVDLGCTPQNKDRTHGTQGYSAEQARFRRSPARQHVSRYSRG